MNKRVGLVLFGGVFLLLFAMIPAVRAGNISNQATQVTFSQPVRIPGRTLPAGTYWLSVDDNGPNQNLNAVKVSNADGTKTIATLATQTTDKTQEGQEATVNGISWPNGKVIFTFAQGSKNRPMTLVSWYYPGRPDGHEFIYTDRVQKQLDEEKHQTLAFNPKENITIGASIASFE